MAVTLVPMAPDELTGWLARGHSAYIDERVASGQRREDAVRTADDQLRQLFPDGKPAPGQYVFWVIGDNDERVGSIWIGEAIGAPADSWWVWNIEIDESARGRGFGREAMLLAEVEARNHGATRLGLNVFGHNLVARRLYERLGYQPSSIQMQKQL